MRYDLKLEGGKEVTWSGDSGADAAFRYVDSHPDTPAVIAWRKAKGPPLSVLTRGAEIDGKPIT